MLLLLMVVDVQELDARMRHIRVLGVVPMVAQKDQANRNVLMARGTAKPCGNWRFCCYGSKYPLAFWRGVF